MVKDGRWEDVAKSYDPITVTSLKFESHFRFGLASTSRLHFVVRETNGLTGDNGFNFNALNNLEVRDRGGCRKQKIVTVVAAVVLLYYCGYCAAAEAISTDTCGCHCAAVLQQVSSQHGYLSLLVELLHYCATAGVFSSDTCGYYCATALVNRG